MTAKANDLGCSHVIVTGSLVGASGAVRPGAGQIELGDFSDAGVLEAGTSTVSGATTFLRPRRHDSDRQVVSRATREPYRW